MPAARYDAVADWYGVGDDQSLPATHSLLGLIGSVRGLRALDLACGHGPISRELARRGAAVVGIDLSPRLLARAREAEYTDQLGITYLAADATSTGILNGDQFDIVVCHFGLTDIDDLDGALATTARLMAPGGTFVFSILHPCFPGFGETSGSWPSNGSYWDQGWWRADGSCSVLRRRVGSNHRTLSTYINALQRHGLVITALDEPPASETLAAGRPEVAKLPLYLILRCGQQRRDPEGSG